MRKLLLVGAAVVALFTSGEARAQAGVWCMNCATLGIQIESAAKDAWAWGEELLYHAQQLEQQIQTVTYFIQNTLSLPERLKNDLLSPIYQAQAMVRQAEMIGQQTKFMISNLGASRGYGGYGGSLADIPLALQQQNFALANAMQTLGLVSRQVNSLSASCASQYASIDGIDPRGIKAATMVGTTMAATSGQCAEARAQMQAAYQNAMATAALREANRQAMMAAADQRDLQANIAAGCVAISSSWACQQQPRQQQGAATQ